MKKKNDNKYYVFGVVALIALVSFYLVVDSNYSKKKDIGMDLLINEPMLGDVQDSCETKDYDKCGCNSITNSTAQEQCRKGCSYCSTCKSGSYKSGGYCYKVTSSTVSEVTVSGKDYIYLAEDESATFTFKAKSSSSEFTPSWSFSPTTGANGRSSGRDYYLTVTGNGKGTNSNCKETEYTVTATSNNTSKSATVKVCKYCAKWQGPYSTTTVYKEKQNTSKQARGCYYFVGESKVDGGWTYTGYYNRCCGGIQTQTPTPEITPPPSTTPTPTSDVTPTPTPTPEPEKACYGNKKYLGIATSVGWQETESLERSYKYEGIDEDECHVINVSTCSISPVNPLPVDIDAEICEDTSEISYNDVTKCSNQDNSFYTIDCTRKITTDFDYGDDTNKNTIRFLYRGQGFKYGVNVTTIHTCTAKFNKDAWIKAYNTFLTKIKYVSSSLVNYIKNNDKNGWSKAVDSLNASKEVKSEVYALWNIIDKLRNIVTNEYLGFVPTNNSEEQVKLSLKYNINGKTYTQNEELVILNSNDGDFSKTYSSTKFDLTSQNELKNIPESYVISNENNPRIIKFIPKRTYIEKYLGLDLVFTDDNHVDGGNKIYLDYNIDSTTNSKAYNMIINVTGLGSNKSSVNNNKCDINVGSEELLYRPIDVSNPFIDSKWKIGENWLNDRFSFTNTIKSDTWSLNKLYDVILSNADIASIQESNKNNKGLYPYLGLCDRLSRKSQDDITKKLCGIIKGTID